MPNQRRAGIVLGYANIFVKNLVNLIYTPMLLSFVGDADYGVYQTSYSFVFSLSLLSFGFSQAYVRFYMQKKLHGTEEDIRRLNGVYLVMYVIVSVVALLFGLCFAASADVLFATSFTLEQIGLSKAVMVIMSASIAVTLFNSVFDAYILAHEQFRFQQTRQIAVTLITPFCAYALLIFGMGVIGVALAQLSVNVVLLILNAVYCIGRLCMRFDVRHLDILLFRSIAAFSAWIFANQICDLVNQNVPNVLLGVLTSASMVAVFAVSLQLRGVFIALSTAISSVFSPEINRIVADSDDNQKLTSLMTRVGRLQMMVYCWAYSEFFLLGGFFVEHWAGPGFSDAYWLTLIMALPLSVPLAQNTGIEIQRAKNKHRVRSIVLLLMALFNVVFTLVASPHIGYWAPAIGYATSILLGNGIFMNWYYHRKIGLDMRIFWQGNTPVILASFLIVIICNVVRQVLPVTNWLSFILWGVGSTLFFVGVLWFMVFTKDERNALASHLALPGGGGK